MRALDPATVAQLANGQIRAMDMVLFDLVSGLYGFFSGEGTIVWNSITWLGSGSLIELDGVEQGSDLSSHPLTIKLRSIPGTDLTPDTLATIEAEFYHQRPCTLYVGYYHPETDALLSVEVKYRGYIDQMVHTDNISIDDTDSTAVLECRLESKFRDHQRQGYRTRSSVDQRLLHSTDTFLDHVITVTEDTVLFGKVATPPPAPAKKSKSFLQKIFG